VRKEKVFFNSLLVSFLFHLLLFGFLELYFRYITKGLLGKTFERERVFEVIPYEPKELHVARNQNKETRFLGPKNIFHEKESIPEQKPVFNRNMNIPNKIEHIPSQIKEEPIIKKKEEIKPQSETIANKSKEGKDSFEQSLKSNVEDKVKLEREIAKKERGLPGLSKLIPESQDIISKLPKEESINLDSGKVKGGKELIINTKEFKYWSYLQKMKQKIELVWEYPEYARMRGISGQLKINFSIGRDGKIEQVYLVDSSGVKVLDDAALKALRDANPFPPFPDTWDISRLNIEGTFIYQITVVR
jgi:protein TonB